MIEEIPLVKRQAGKYFHFMPVHTVPKKNGERRFILDARSLNEELSKKTFKMTTIKYVKELMQKGDWFTKIDLKSAFTQVPVAKRDRDYLCFNFRGRAWRFRGLPFGLSQSPYWLTKVLQPVVAYAQRKGICIIQYLDDFLIISKSKTEAKKNTEIFVAILIKLGIAINWEKSVLTPNKVIPFLGFILDSKKMQIIVPRKKRRLVKHSIKKFQERIQETGKTSARDVASILGLINSLSEAVLSARVYTGSLHSLKDWILKKTKFRWFPEWRQAAFHRCKKRAGNFRNAGRR